MTLYHRQCPTYRPNLNLDTLCLEVESDLQLQVLHNGSEDLHPVLLQWCEAVWGDGHLAKLWTPTLSQGKGNGHRRKKYPELWTLAKWAWPQDLP